jgi:hypothetical protein
MAGQALTPRPDLAAGAAMPASKHSTVGSVTDSTARGGAGGYGTGIGSTSQTVLASFGREGTGGCDRNASIEAYGNGGNGGAGSATVTGSTATGGAGCNGIDGGRGGRGGDASLLSGYGGSTDGDTAIGGAGGNGIGTGTGGAGGYAVSGGGGTGVGGACGNGTGAIGINGAPGSSAIDNTDGLPGGYGANQPC